ncbi:MAG: hypothetical protein ABEK59_02160 [Halobacteria archaeon]
MNDQLSKNILNQFKGAQRKNMEKVRGKILELLEQNEYKSMKQSEISERLKDFSDYSFSLANLNITLKQMERDGEILREEPDFETFAEVIVKPSFKYLAEQVNKEET